MSPWSRPLRKVIKAVNCWWGLLPTHFKSKEGQREGEEMVLWLVGFNFVIFQESKAFQLYHKLSLIAVLSSFKLYIKTQTAIFSKKPWFYIMKKQESIQFQLPYLQKEYANYCYGHLVENMSNTFWISSSLRRRLCTNSPVS